jgi:triosephosphate isomerase
VHAQLRALVSALASPAVAETCPILYGGSVKSENMTALVAEPDVDGGLVGGASLRAQDFVGIVRAVLRAREQAPARASAPIRRV